MNQQFVLPKQLRRDAVIQRLANVLLALDPARAWCIEIHEHVSRRSTQQNRYLFGVVYPTIAKHLPGWEVTDIHDYFLGEWSGWETLEGLGRKRLRPIRRSSKLSKLEFADYVGFIQRKAADHGIFVPDPDPDYYLKDRAA